MAYYDEQLVDSTNEVITGDTVPDETPNYNVGRVFDEKNYLDTKIPEGKSEKTLKIRLLPFPETSSPFLHIHMHSVQVPVEVSKSGFKSYVCVEKTEGIDKNNYGGKCPFCELNNAAYKDMQNEKDPTKKEYYKKLSLQNLAKPVVIMRCIERGKEDEGVKFWKVNVRQDKGDAYNLIRTLHITRMNEWLADPDNAGRDQKESNILSWREYGYDLTVTFKTKEEINTKTHEVVKKTSVQITDAKKPSPLSTDMEKVKEWIYDPKKWYEVFPPKHYDYTALIMQGKVPFYDKSLGKWVSKEARNESRQEKVDEVDAEIQKAQLIAAGVPQGVIAQETPETTKSDSVSAVGDDLPF